MSRPVCKACGVEIPYRRPDGSIDEHCFSCGHRYDCSGCGACQHCPKCGNDRHTGDCKPRLPSDDLVTYLEMARFVMDLPNSEGLKEQLDISDEEFDRLKKQLIKHLEGE